MRRIKRLDVFAEVLEFQRVCVNVAAVDPTFLDQNVRQSVEQRQVRLRRQRQMLRRRHRGLRPSRVDHDDFRLMRIAQHPLPHDRMGDAQVRADQHNYVRLFKVGVGVRRRVEAERLLVGDHGRGHALARVPVAVNHADAEFRQCAEKGHLFAGDLPRAQEGDRLGAVSALNLF